MAELTEIITTVFTTLVNILTAIFGFVWDTAQHLLASAKTQQPNQTSKSPIVETKEPKASTPKVPIVKPDQDFIKADSRDPQYQTLAIVQNTDFFDSKKKT